MLSRNVIDKQKPPQYWRTETAFEKIFTVFTLATMFPRQEHYSTVFNTCKGVFFIPILHKLKR